MDCRNYSLFIVKFFLLCLNFVTFFIFFKSRAYSYCFKVGTYVNFAVCVFRSCRTFRFSSFPTTHVPILLHNPKKNHLGGLNSIALAPLRPMRKEECMLLVVVVGHRAHDWASVLDRKCVLKPPRVKMSIIVPSSGIFSVLRYQIISHIAISSAWTMDEGTLNDLLECSVCLDRLDTSSKVLPCQHTFCRKCLQEIVHKHKELRCPECRILVSAKVDELPPNVLLMRILEGIKNNAVPKKQQRALRSIQAPAVNHAQVHQQTPERKINNKQNTQIVPHQPYAKALYDYEQKEAG